MVRVCACVWGRGVEGGGVGGGGVGGGRGDVIDSAVSSLYSSFEVVCSLGM